MLQKLRNAVTLAWNSLFNQVGAFALTNKQFATRDAAWIPAAHAELADQTLATSGSTLTTATQNTGIVGLKWIRLRCYLKTLGGLAAGEFIRATIQAGTGAAITGPTNIAQNTIFMQTGDTEICFDVLGYSQAGFQSYAIILDSDGTSRVSVLDLMVDCA